MQNLLILWFLITLLLKIVIEKQPFMGIFSTLAVIHTLKVLWEHTEKLFDIDSTLNKDSKDTPIIKFDCVIDFGTKWANILHGSSKWILSIPTIKFSRCTVLWGEIGARFRPTAKPQKTEPQDTKTQKMMRLNPGRISWGTRGSIKVSLVPAKPYPSMPYRQPTPSRPNGRLGVGRPQGDCTILLEGPPLTPHEIRTRAESRVEQGRRGHRRTAWGAQGGRRRPQAAHPVGGPPLRQLSGRIRGSPPLRHRRVWRALAIL
jgi:hypothetical protein